MSVIIKFGKTHKGKKVEDCPSEYLQWLVDNLDPLDPNWGAQNKKLVDASKNVLTARSQGLLKAPKSPVVNQKPVQTTTEPSLGRIKPVQALKEDLEIANQALQRIAFALEAEEKKNNDQPY